MRDGRGATADRTGRLPRATRKTAGQGSRIHARDGAQGAGGSQARGVSRKATKTKFYGPARFWLDEKIALPILLGDEAKIRARWKSCGCT